MAKTTKKADAAVEGVGVYTVTGAQARKALTKAGIALTPDALLKAEAKGGAVGSLARHTRKWLPTDEAETTLALTASDASTLHGHGLPLTRFAGRTSPID